MILKKRTLLTASLFLAATFGFAQTQTREGLESMRRSAISPIFSGNEVNGYLLFYKADKADKKNDNYGMDFYDQDLNVAKTITVQKPRNSTFLLENSYNGNVFGFYFYNIKDKSLEIETYDSGLNKIASKKITELSKVDNMLIQQELQKGSSGDASSIGLNLLAAPGKGFIRNSFDGMMKGFNLELLDDKLQQKWKVSSEKNAKYYESISINEVTDKYVLGTIGRRDGMMSKKVNFFLVAYDVNTGKKAFEKNIETGAKEQLSASSFSYDNEKQEFLVFGEYYKPEDKPMIDKSLGFFVKSFSPAGKQTSSKLYAWEKEVKAKLPAPAKASIEQGFINFTHNFFKGADGKTYIVAEQYRIAADGWGIAGKALGAKTSVTKGVIGNMLVMVLNPDNSLAEIKLYEKDPSNVELMPGSGLQGAGLLGQQMKMTGGFDYQFMQKSNDGSNFNVVYVNYDKEKGESTKKVLGNVMVGNDGKFAQDKIDMTTKSTNSYIYPGKAGYLMMVDYLKKEKKLGMKLVKLNG